VPEDERNPYSAPKVPVADPTLVPVERPRAVTRAVRLLWISLLIAVAGAIDSFETPPDWVSEVLVFFSNVLWFGLAACFIFKLSRGRRWARTAYLIVAIFSYGLLAMYWGETVERIKDEPYQIAILLSSAATELIALYLLFTKPANDWFALPARLPGP